MSNPTHLVQKIRQNHQFWSNRCMTPSVAAVCIVGSYYYEWLEFHRNLVVYICSVGIKNYKDFWPKINMLKRKHCILGNWQKLPKLDFQNQFLLSKIIQIFFFVCLKNMNLGAHCLLLTYFDNFNL
jgi:hypothetical protein